jgi:hypothetical protein
MGIDRIGKGGAPPAPDTKGTESLEKKGAVDKPFAANLERPDAAKQASATEAAQAAQASSPLARLRAGEIDVNGYMDLKVDEATHGLQGLPRAELDEIKRVLRDQLATDPGLTDLVRTATGQIPKPPED